MIRAYRGVVPKIAASAYIDPSAQVIGDVEIGERSSVWPNATIRGDVNYIRIGEETNIQDNSVLHVRARHVPADRRQPRDGRPLGDAARLRRSKTSA